MSTRPAISPISSVRSGVAGSAWTSAVCASKPLISELLSGATPENTRYWSLGSAQSMRLMPGSSKYSALLAETPMPTVPDQSVTSGSSALR